MTSSWPRMLAPTGTKMGPSSLAVPPVQRLASVDVDAYKAGIRTYTDFLADYCSVAPDRLIGCMLLPNTGVDDAISEIEHGRNRGLRAVCVQNWPNGTGD